MADKNYATVAGNVQQFVKDGETQPVITEREVNDQTVREFTIKTLTRDAQGKQNLVRVTLWPEFEDVTLVRGQFVSIDGNFTVNKGNNGKVFYNVTAYSLSLGIVVGKKEREASATETKPTQNSDDVIF